MIKHKGKGLKNVSEHKCNFGDKCLFKPNPALEVKKEKSFVSYWKKEKTAFYQRWFPFFEGYQIDALWGYVKELLVRQRKQALSKQLEEIRKENIEKNFFKDMDAYDAGKKETISKIRKGLPKKEKYPPRHKGIDEYNFGQVNGHNSAIDEVLKLLKSMEGGEK